MDNIDVHVSWHKHLGRWGPECIGWAEANGTRYYARKVLIDDPELSRDRIEDAVRAMVLDAIKKDPVKSRP